MAAFRMGGKLSVSNKNLEILINLHFSLVTAQYFESILLTRFDTNRFVFNIFVRMTRLKAIIDVLSVSILMLRIITAFDQTNTTFSATSSSGCNVSADFGTLSVRAVLVNINQRVAG